MSLNPSEDIRSVTDLKRKTKVILNHVHRTKRPVVLTVNGEANAVLMDTKTYEKHLRASNMTRLLVQVEEDVVTERTRSMSFQKEFKHAATFRASNTGAAKNDIEEARSLIARTLPQRKHCIRGSRSFFSPPNSEKFQLS
jgi:prevent-host-death family protein